MKRQWHAARPDTDFVLVQSMSRRGRDSANRTFDYRDRDVHPQYKEPLQGVGTARGSLHPSSHLEGLPETAISQDLALLGPLKGFIRYLTHDSTKTREKYGVKGVSLI